MMANSHKPRKRRKDEEFSQTGQDISKALSKTSKPTPPFPLAAFLWSAKKSTSQWILLPLILMAVGLFRWTTGFWGYSGKPICRQAEEQC